MLHSALPPCSKACRPAIFCDFLAPNFVAGADWCVLVHCCVCAVSWCSNGTMQCLCCVSGCCRGRGCKEGAGGTLPPAVLVRKFVSGCAVRAEVRLWAGSQPLGSLALAQFGRGYRQNENETNVRHSVRSETPKVRHSCGGASYVTFYPRLVKTGERLPAFPQAAKRHIEKVGSLGFM